MGAYILPKQPMWVFLISYYVLKWHVYSMFEKTRFLENSTVLYYGKFVGWWILEWMDSMKRRKSDIGADMPPVFAFRLAWGPTQRWQASLLLSQYSEMRTSKMYKYVTVYSYRNYTHIYFWYKSDALRGNDSIPAPNHTHVMWLSQWSLRINLNTGYFI